LNFNGRPSGKQQRPSETVVEPGPNPLPFPPTTSSSADSATYARFGGKENKKPTVGNPLQQAKYLSKVLKECK